MGFRLSDEELAKFFSRQTVEYYDAELLRVYWLTSPATVGRLLPPPLKPAPLPLVMAFVANYPRTDAGLTYREAALFLLAEFDGRPGAYCLAMPVTDDMAMIHGRELFGYPKKLADIAFHREGQEAGGWAERRGVRFFELRASLTGKLNAEDARPVIARAAQLGNASHVATVYNFKHFFAPDFDGFDYPPRLVRDELESHPVEAALGEAEVVLRPSEHDPWSEVEVVRVLGAVYTKGNNSMRRGQVVAEADPVAFAPYSRLKVDPW